MSKEKRLSQEPGWVKDYNNAQPAGRGKQVSMPNQIVKRILERGPFTKEDLKEAFEGGVERTPGGPTFDEWFDNYLNNRVR